MRGRMIRRMKCPHCQNVLHEKTVPTGTSPVTIDECTRCGGIWFDADELKQYVNSRRKPHRSARRAVVPVASESEDSQAHCPRCENTPLQMTEAPRFSFQKCTQCKGVFARRAELTRIVAQTRGKESAEQQNSMHADIAGVGLSMLLEIPLVVLEGLADF